MEKYTLRANFWNGSLVMWTFGKFKNAFTRARSLKRFYKNQKVKFSIK
jgi:hypothetical protein